MSEVRVSPRDLGAPGGSEVQVSLGDEVVVDLPENAGTGYLWSVRRVEGGLEVTGSAYEPPGRPLPGAGGRRVVRVRPTEVGEGLVHLVLKRPWEDEVRDRLSLRVTTGRSRAPSRPPPRGR
ncbi:protease inhibitor I42 family protein [Streptomyces sp. NBC_01275]|uniref:protease inhibitor I42 family protein n=1 Tax=Streptomyces sp. NBC_01275 TaxID=2903807 RepID=UPI002254920B|nr:protease inhibitor I42 family protein [Streptomyces sp. NBC_01275]MCX4766911.1 protease inhibitor I42 family protein [Streptomyces sp. NBC_01275]